MPKRTEMNGDISEVFSTAPRSKRKEPAVFPLLSPRAVFHNDAESYVGIVVHEQCLSDLERLDHEHYRRWHEQCDIYLVLTTRRQLQTGESLFREFPHFRVSEKNKTQSLCIEKEWELLRRHQSPQTEADVLVSGLNLQRTFFDPFSKAQKELLQVLKLVELYGENRQLQIAPAWSDVSREDMLALFDALDRAIPSSLLS